MAAFIIITTLLRQQSSRFDLQTIEKFRKVEMQPCGISSNYTSQIV